MKKSKERHVGESITRLFKSLGLNEEAQQYMPLAYWDIAVGKEVAKHAEPQKITEGILFVKVKDAVWRNELTYLKHEIMQKLNAHVGKNAIKEIKFY